VIQAAKQRHVSPIPHAVSIYLIGIFAYLHVGINPTTASNDIRILRVHCRGHGGGEFSAAESLEIRRQLDSAIVLFWGGCESLPRLLLLSEVLFIAGPNVEKSCVKVRHTLPSVRVMSFEPRAVM
jgi:hypothetical protein